MILKSIYGILIASFFIATSSWSQDQMSSNDIITKMKNTLDLQEDQVHNITPIIDKYTTAMNDLQKSINDGTINSSAVDSQKQGIEAAETQEISSYLKPYQLSEWGQLQAQIYQQHNDGNSDADAGGDQYSNLPNR